MIDLNKLVIEIALQCLSKFRYIFLWPFLLYPLWLVTLIYPSIEPSFLLITYLPDTLISKINTPIYYVFNLFVYLNIFSVISFAFGIITKLIRNGFSKLGIYNSIFYNEATDLRIKIKEKMILLYLFSGNYLAAIAFSFKLFLGIPDYWLFMCNSFCYNLYYAPLLLILTFIVVYIFPEQSG